MGRGHWQILGVEARMSRISNLSAFISRCGHFLLLIVQWFSESLHHAKASSVVKTLITSKEYCNEMLHTNCHALHFMLPSDAKIQKNAVQVFTVGELDATSFSLNCSLVLN